MLLHRRPQPRRFGFKYRGKAQHLGLPADQYLQCHLPFLDRFREPRPSVVVQQVENIIDEFDRGDFFFVPVGMNGGNRVACNWSRDPRSHTASVVYVAEAHGEPRAQDDAAGVALFNPETLPSVLVFDHARILRDYLIWRRQGKLPPVQP